MLRLRAAAGHAWLLALLALAALALCPRSVRGQEGEPLPEKKDTTLAFPNTTAGELTPGSGFDLVSTDFGTLNISFYGVFRYVNHTPLGQTFRDHLGREREILERNDMNWHRTFVWLTGWFWNPKFRYNVTIWSLGTTQQA